MQKICNFIVMIGIGSMILLFGLQSVYEVGEYNENYEFRIQNFVDFFDDEQGFDFALLELDDDILTFRAEYPFRWLNIFIVPMQTMVRFLQLIAKILYYVGVWLVRFPQLFI